MISETRGFNPRPTPMANKMTHPIRPATPQDRAVVETIVDAAYAHYIPRIGRKPGPMLDDHAAMIQAGYVHLIEHDGAIQGVLTLIPQDGIMLLDNIAVAPAAQGLGLGRALLEFAEATAVGKGYGAIKLYTNAAMSENIALYSRIGYIKTHRAEEKGLHRIYMRKILS